MNEEEGIKAIIALQALAGITEPYERAKRGWQSMSPAQQEQTEWAFKALMPDETGPVLSVAELNEEAYEDAACDCFDYIMNDPRFYRELGNILGMLQRRAKREGKELERELFHPTTWRHKQFASDRGPRVMEIPVRPGWLRKMNDLLDRARTDYFRCFTEEAKERPPEWYADKIPEIRERVLRIANKCSDRWKEIT